MSIKKISTELVGIGIVGVRDKRKHAPACSEAKAGAPKSPTAVYCRIPQAVSRGLNRDSLETVHWTVSTRRIETLRWQRVGSLPIR